MIPNAKRGPLLAFAIAVRELAAMCGRRSAHLLFDALQGAYDTHMERVQMRLAPVKSRSWRDIPRLPEPRTIVIAAGTEHKSFSTVGSKLPQRIRSIEAFDSCLAHDPVKSTAPDHVTIT